MSVTLVVEDGTGLVDANSYAAIMDSDIYHNSRGNSAWQGYSADQKATALIRATDYVDQRYGGRFIGTLATAAQALAWPRENTGDTTLDFDDVTLIGVVPIKLQRACFEYGLRAVLAQLAPDPIISDSGVTMVTTLQKAGPVEQQSERAAGRSNASSVFLLRPYPNADMYLRGLILPANRTIR